MGGQKKRKLKAIKTCVDLRRLASPFGQGLKVESPNSIKDLRYKKERPSYFRQQIKLAF